MAKETPTESGIKIIPESLPEFMQQARRTWEKGDPDKFLELLQEAISQMIYMGETMRARDAESCSLLAVRALFQAYAIAYRYHSDNLAGLISRLMSWTMIKITCHPEFEWQEGHSVDVKKELSRTRQTIRSLIRGPESSSQ